MERTIMKRSYLSRLVYNSTLAGLICAYGAGLAFGQFQPFTQNRDKIKIHASGFPADIQKGYQLFRDKCNACHGLDTSLKPSMPAAQWTFVVKKMQAMASSRFNDTEAKAILDFLNYDETHRKSLNKPAAGAAAAGLVSSGRQFYDSQGCEACHSIGGKGGSGGPDLTGVGTRLSRDQLMQLMQSLKSGKNDKMPSLPAETTEEQIKNLVDYLTTLRGS